jgi:hypothetical protein
MTTQPVQPKKKLPIVLIVIVALIAFCIFCLVVSSAMNAMGLIPTSTPSPIPSSTPLPLPTNTPLPTETPAPTDTPLPPTATPAPIILQGSGDSVVDVPKNSDPAIAKITYQGGGNFGLWNDDANGEHIDLLVNVIGSYQGVVPLDFLKNEHTTRFEISAEGNWTIEILPLSQARKESIPGTIQGNGDDVIFISDSGTPDLLKADASSAEGNFAVWEYGTDRDLLINEIAPYTGTVALDKNTVLLVVQATGPWSFEISTK